MTELSLHERLKNEGRLNLLYRLSEPTVLKISLRQDGPLAPPPNVLPFVSRAEHLKWRNVWTQGRFVRLSWPPDQRAAILRQDAIFREADAKWAERHGPVEGGARVLAFTPREAEIG
jgi:hypothetical protein